MKEKIEQTKRRRSNAWIYLLFSCWIMLNLISLYLDVDVLFLTHFFSSKVKVYRISAQQPQLAMIHEYLRNHDVWAVAPNHLDVLVDLQKVKQVAMEFNVTYNVLIHDVDLLLHQSHRQQVRSKKGWFEKYHRYDEIIQMYRDLAAKDSRVQVEQIGKSYEKRDIHVVRFGAKNKAMYYIQAGIHAREWISPAVCQYLVLSLLQSKDPKVQELLLNGEFVIVPVVNPDGYEYTWTNNRMWRKNRRPHYGVDLNRNFNACWGHGGSSSNPMAEDYMGESAESEPEIQTISQFLRNQSSIVMALGLHSYSQLILRPIGWQYKDSPHEQQLSSISKKMSQIIEQVNNKYYDPIKSIELYPTSGGSDDFFYMQKYTFQSKTIRPYSLTIELRPQGSKGNGFLLDPKHIIPTGSEILPAVVALAQEALRNPLIYLEEVLCS